MTSYQDVIRQVGDQWVAVLRQAEQSVGKFSESVQQASAGLEVPKVDLPEPLAKLNEALAEHLPSPSEIIQANFDLATRLLEAQRELALKLLEASPGAAKSTDA